MTLVAQLQRIAKAIVGGITAAVAAFATANTDGVINDEELWGILAALVLTFITVYFKRNKPA